MHAEWNNEVQRRILFQSGFFDAPWSKRSWINDPFSDFPKETHPSSKPFKRFPPCSIDLALHLLMFWKFQISFHSYYWVIVLMSEFVNNFIQIKHFGIMAWSGRRLQSFVLLRRKSIMEICTKTKPNMIVKKHFHGKQKSDCPFKVISTSLWRR